MFALGCGNHAEVVRNGGVAGQNIQGVTIGRLGLIKTSALVMRYCVRDKLVEITLGSSHHVPTNVSTEV